jgi:hypothetical protein
MINAVCQKVRKYKFIIEYLKIAERWEGEEVERRWAGGRLLVIGFPRNIVNSNFSRNY